MRERKTTKNKSFTEVLRTLRAIIAGPDYNNGGWLPPIRSMSKRLGASYMTYSKALDCLTAEGLARSFPCKGHFVSPEYLRVRKIGVILGGGGDSPFINEEADLPGALKCLSEKLFFTQIIQGSSLERIRENVTVHGIAGLLWLLPPPEAAPVIGEIHKTDTPLMVVKSEGYEHNFSAPVIIPDWRQYDRDRVRAMAARGHRQLIRIYANEKQIEAFAEDLAGAGIVFRPDSCVPMSGRKPGQVLAAIKKSGATGIIAEGGLDSTNELFSELSGLPASAQPEILHYPIGYLIALHGRYPSAKLLTMGYKNPNLGGTAAQILAEHITEGKPLRSVPIKLETTGPAEHWRSPKQKNIRRPA